MCDVGVLALGADGVRLAVELLDEKIYLAAGRVAAVYHGAQLSHVAAQTHGLLVNGDAVSEDRGLGDYTVLVYAGGTQHLGHLLLKAAAIFKHRVRRFMLDPRDEGIYRCESGEHIVPQLLALAQTHRVKIAQRLLRDGADAGGYRLRVRLLLLYGQHVRKAADAHRCGVVRELMLLGDMLYRLKIAAQERLVDAHGHIVRH